MSKGRGGWVSPSCLAVGLGRLGLHRCKTRPRGGRERAALSSRRSRHRLPRCVFVAPIAYLTLPSMLSALLGAVCS